jgi:hypothetical protein
MSHLKTEKSTTSSEGLDVSGEVNEQDPSAHRKASLANSMEAERFDVRKAPAKTPRQILVEEKRDKGTVAFHHWFELMKMNGGPSYFTAFTVFTVLSVLGPVAERELLKCVDESRFVAC